MNERKIMRGFLGHGPVKKSKKKVERPIRGTKR